MKKNRILALALCLLLLLAVLNGCAAKSAAPQEAVAEGAYDNAYVEAPAAAEYKSEAFAEPEMAMPEPEEAIATESVAGNIESAGGEAVKPDEQPTTDFAAKIIYSADLNLQTTEFDKAVATLEAMVKSFGGFVENSNVYGDIQYQTDGTSKTVNRWAYYTLRVPAQKFEQFLSQTSGIGNVVSSSRNAENVTSRYTDFEARLDSLRTQEDRLLAMLEKAEDVDSLIALEQRLADVRYETESIERNLRNLDMQISYSTVCVNLQEVEIYTPTVPVQRSFGEKLSDALSDGWSSFVRGIQRFFLGLVESLPGLILFLLIVAALFFIVRAIVRKIRRKKQKAKDAANTAEPQTKDAGKE